MMTDTAVALGIGTSASLIALLRRGPAVLRLPLLRALRIGTDSEIKKAISRALVVFWISGAIAFNRVLNHLARNNWVLTKKSQWTWPNEIAVVTGGCGGIGAKIVEGLASKGVKVAVVDIADLPEELAKYENVQLFKCDITSKEAVNETAAQITAALGAPSILCNNAGIAHAHTILESSPQYLRKLYDINVLSHFNTLQAFLPNMIARKKGHIVSTCSMSSFVTPSGLVDYAGSKAAVMAIHEGLQQELKHRYNTPEIRTTIVHPAYVKTPLVESYAKALETTGAYQLLPEPVAAEIVAAILSGSSRQIILPRFLSFASALRAFPYWMQEMVRGITKDDMQRL